MAELVRLFDPAARLQGRDGSAWMRSGQIYLTRPAVIDPGVAAEARVPPGLRWPILCSCRAGRRHWTWGLSSGEKRKLRDSAILLLPVYDAHIGRPDPLVNQSQNSITYGDLLEEGPFSHPPVRLRLRLRPGNRP